MSSTQPPRLPDPPAEYDQQYLAQFGQALTLFFQQLTSLQALSGTALSLDLRTLPTQADVANLRPGDVYVDTAAGNVLKIKT